MHPLSRGAKKFCEDLNLSLYVYLVQNSHKIQLFFFLLNTFLSISIIMLAAFPPNVLEKDAIKLMKIGSGVKTPNKI